MGGANVIDDFSSVGGGSKGDFMSEQQFDGQSDTSSIRQIKIFRPGQDNEKTFDSLDFQYDKGLNKEVTDQIREQILAELRKENLL